MLSKKITLNEQEFCAAFMDMLNSILSTHLPKENYEIEKELLKHSYIKFSDVFKIISKKTGIDIEPASNFSDVLYNICIGIHFKKIN